VSDAGRAVMAISLSAGKIRLLIVEANPMVGQLIAGALKRCRQYFDILASCSDSLEGIYKSRELVPEVALISVELRDGPLMGFKVLRELNASQVRTAAIMLMDFDERDLVVDAFREGARGIFCRDRSFNTLSKCIRTVHSGQIWASNEQLQFLLDAVRQVRRLYLTAPNGAKLLTPREEEVTRLVADGLKNREISIELNVSEHTIRNYLFQIFDKLGVSSRIELVIFAFTHPAAVAPSDSASPRRIESQYIEAKPLARRAPGRN
jgi:two-component system nitrate/nitrite response regulator NarL